MHFHKRVVLGADEQDILIRAIDRSPLPDLPMPELQEWLPSQSGSWRGTLIRELRGDGRSFRGRLIREAGLGERELRTLRTFLSESLSFLHKQPLLFGDIEGTTRTLLRAAADLVERCHADVVCDD